MLVLETEEINRIDVLVEELKPALVKKLLEPFQGTQTEMVIALGTDFQVIYYVLFVQDFLAIVAPGPQTFIHHQAS